MKTCSKCKTGFPLDEFYDDNRARDGKRSQCRNCICQASDVYRRQHLEIYSNATFQYRIKHSYRWRQNHRVYMAKRRAQIVGSLGYYTRKDIATLFDAFDGRCCWCFCPLIVYHVDHIIPLSKGGSNEPSNIALACPSCNLSKHDRLPNDWLWRKDTQCPA